MDSIKPLICNPQPFVKNILPWTLFVLLPIALVRLYFYPLPFSPSPSNQLQNKPTNSSSSSTPPYPPIQAERVVSNDEIACDYSNGVWIRDDSGPLYDGKSCGKIMKQRENCLINGRPDMGYLYWRWKPKLCALPRFEPEKFLQFLRNKNLAFVGDSIARNQMESLLCMMATVSSPILVYSKGKDDRFRKWHFPSHNVSVSSFWAPFLVRGTEKSLDDGINHNTLYLDSADEKWAGEISHLDMIVLSAGNWFLQEAVYFNGDSVIGCHICPGKNYTEIGFYEPYGNAYRAALNAIVDRKGRTGNSIDVILSTFSPHHFEGEWNKSGKCPKTRPYNASEKKLEGVDAEMRNIGVQEMEKAKMRAYEEFGKEKFRFEAMDVSTLSLLRPDGHPGEFFYPSPNGTLRHGYNDCVHWCLPGPIDTWNEILLEVMKSWEGQFRDRS